MSKTYFFLTRSRGDTEAENTEISGNPMGVLTTDERDKHGY